jgi:hypothetical protein
MRLLHGWQAVKLFLREKAVNYPVVLGDGSVAQVYGGVESLPTTFLIDPRAGSPLSMLA